MSINYRKSALLFFALRRELSASKSAKLYYLDLFAFVASRLQTNTLNINFPSTFYAPVAIKDGKKRLPEFPIHETVCDRIAARTEVRQQLHERNTRRPNVFVNVLRIEQVPGVENMQRRPADEEFSDNHEQHPYHLRKHINQSR